MLKFISAILFYYDIILKVISLIVYDNKNTCIALAKLKFRQQFDIKNI